MLKVRKKMGEKILEMLLLNLRKTYLVNNCNKMVLIWMKNQLKRIKRSFHFG